MIKRGASIIDSNGSLILEYVEKIIGDVDGSPADNIVTAWKVGYGKRGGKVDRYL